MIKYGLAFHPTVPVNRQLLSYVPDHGARLAPQVTLVDPSTLKDENGRMRALVKAAQDGCTLDRPIIFVDDGWLSQWGPQPR